MAEAFGVRGRGRFYEEVGAIRDVFQNHLLQVLSLLTMEPPTVERRRVDRRGEGGAPARPIRPLAPGDVVRGQYRGYRAETGVAPDSHVETYVAARLWVDNPRWAGVPMLDSRRQVPGGDGHRGARHPQTAGAGALRLGHSRRPNEIRFRLSPDLSITLMASVKKAGEAMVGEDASLIEHAQAADEMAPYERLLGDALRGERTLFGSEAGVEASWQIVEPVLGDTRPPDMYEPGSWGPSQSELGFSP